MRRWLPLSLIPFLICVLAVGPVEATPASGVVGNGTPGSCNEANLAAALAGGGSVTFNCGGPQTILLTAVNTLSHNTTLDGGGVITLTGSLTSTTHLFAVNSGLAFTLKNIVLANGYASDGDGGAIANRGTLTLQNTTIQNSKTDVTHSGGALFSAGPVFISNSHFLFNTAGSGGALFAQGAGARVQADHSNFSDNQAFNALTGYGGAILVSGTAQLSLDQSLVELNQAYFGGGLFIAPGSVVTVSAATTQYAFQYNFAQISGGAVNNQAGGRLTTVGAIFDHNHVFTNTADAGTGGAIFSAGPLALYNTYLLYNAAKYGGGLMLDVAGSPTPIVLDHTAFDLNTAAISGGGLYASFSSAWITITSSIFDENSAGSAGGAIARHRAHLTILDSSFLRNFAGSGPGGGGLWLDGSGGSAAGGAVQVLDSTFSGNHAAALGRGGGLYNAGAEANLRNVTLAENDGGIYLTGAGVALSTTNSVFWNDGYLNCDGSGAHPLSLGGNYSSDSSCNFSLPSDKTDVNHDPLGPRVIETADEMYGIVYYLPLPADSLINSALPVCSARDQRGAARPNACDKGAVELGGLLPRIFAPFVRK